MDEASLGGVFHAVGSFINYGSPLLASIELGPGSCRAILFSRMMFASVLTQYRG